MNIQTDKVYSLKMSNGEEIITKVVEVNDSWIAVTEPVSVAQGPQGMGLIPSMFTAEQGKNIQINIKNVTMMAETEDNVRMKYIEATTGIKVPEKKIVLG